ncbi:MAG: hypothetical protein LBP59_09340 [Planctomycetaceae bacterium]|nr:hypothetical protein [Planctomycetaceae bacterium]
MSVNWFDKICLAFGFFVTINPAACDGLFCPINVTNINDKKLKLTERLNHGKNDCI